RLKNMLLIEHASSLPGYSSYLSIDPFQNIGLVVFCRCEEELTAWADTFVRWVAPAYTGHQQEAHMVPSEWKKYEGRYVGPAGVVYIVVHDGALCLYEPARADSLYILEPKSSENSFRLRGGLGLYISDGDPVSFLLDGLQRVESLKIANMFFYPH